jgi:hypothetical protein
MIARNIGWWGNILNQEDWHSGNSLYFYSRGFRFEYRQKYRLYRLKFVLIFLRSSRQISAYYLNKTTTISFQIISNLLFTSSKLHNMRYYTNSETRRHVLHPYVNSSRPSIFLISLFSGTVLLCVLSAWQTNFHIREGRQAIL